MLGRSYRMLRVKHMNQAFTMFSQSVPRFDDAAMSAEPCFLQTVDVGQLN
jgi:hypothetical protein